MNCARCLREVDHVVITIEGDGDCPGLCDRCRRLKWVEDNRLLCLVLAGLVPMIGGLIWL